MSEVDFKQALTDAGIPTTEAGLSKAWESEVAAQGSKLSNTSAYSPFWRLITALVTKPVLWLISFISDTVLPNFFVKTAGDTWLDMLAALVLSYITSDPSIALASATAFAVSEFRPSRRARAASMSDWRGRA